ncbi:MAG TPA: hypothetical protein DSN98_05390 [Thermoplasmata archaeon]|jgi:hypothetical protein|nr:MAG TPA: hypothetical protein DSN98_05390 [Thermoplasmata archaeon]
MLRCLKDTDGVVGLTLSQIGLFLATGILLTVVFSLVFSSDWQRTAELQSIASSFSNLLGNIDNRFFEQTTQFQFPKKDYTYTVKISMEYIVIASKGSWDADLSVSERLLIRPWPRFSQPNWTTGEDLHSYLNKTCGHRGTKNDSLPAVNFTQLCNEQNSTISYFAAHPLEIIMREPVFLEKVSIYSEEAKKQDFLLIYQLS